MSRIPNNNAERLAPILALCAIHGFDKIDYISLMMAAAEKSGFLVAGEFNVDANSGKTVVQSFTLSGETE